MARRRACPWRACSKRDTPRHPDDLPEECPRQNLERPHPDFAALDSPFSGAARAATSALWPDLGRGPRRRWRGTLVDPATHTGPAVPSVETLTAGGAGSGVEALAAGEPTSLGATAGTLAGELRSQPASAQGRASGSKAAVARLKFDPWSSVGSRKVEKHLGFERLRTSSCICLNWTGTRPT